MGLRGRKAKVPTCHPDRKHEAKGLCASCYAVTLARKHPSKVSARMRVWRANNKEKVLAHQVARYGLTLQEYRDLYNAQHQKCAICTKHLDIDLQVGGGMRDNRAHIDHDHSTELVRGLLCGSCNMLLGCAKDSIDVLKAAIIYLEELGG